MLRKCYISISKARWSSTADSLYTFRTVFSAVVQARNTLAENGDAKVRACACSVRQFHIIVALCSAEHVLFHTVALSNVLQGQSVNFVEATSD